MPITRRTFLKNSVLTAAGAAILPEAIRAAMPASAFTAPVKSGHLLGLQLYTVRDAMNKDMTGTLKQVAAMGYRHVEHAGYWERRFYGHSAVEFKKILNDLGLDMHSGHTSLEKQHWDETKKDFTDKWKYIVEDAATVGQQYVITPALDESWRTDYDTTLRYMEVLNKCGSLCKKSGLKFGYHNHNFEFTTRFNGKRLYDVILQNTDPALVAHQMDMGNMYGAGGRALEILKQYPGRYELMHVKDEIKGSDGMDGYESTILGAGVVGTRQVVEEGLRSGGTVQLIIEQEAYQGKDPIDCAKEDLSVMKKWGLNIGILLLLCGFLSSCSTGTNKQIPAAGGKLYEYSQNSIPRWSSPENKNGEKGKGAMSNSGGKGSASVSIPAGSSFDLLDIRDQGIISRIWITISDRSPAMLRALKLEMFWDNESQPAVSVPLGDFFGVGLGRMAAFHNQFFADPEGRSFNCYIPMPFRKGARIRVTNESDKVLGSMFFDVDYQLTKEWDEGNLYFHAFWHRDTATKLGKDFEVLPQVSGRGRFLGMNVGVNSNPLYQDLWWGEGEVKMFLDGDADFPTLAGTGTEDYIGTAWGQDKFFMDYSGCLIADWKNFQWAWYRYHIPDPIFFESECRVTLAQMGGGPNQKVYQLQQQKVPIMPVAVYDKSGSKFVYKKDSVTMLVQPAEPGGWTNFYRSDDVSATAYYYLDKPAGSLPAIQPLNIRTYNLKDTVH